MLNPLSPSSRRAIALYWLTCACVGCATGFFTQLASPAKHASPPRWLVVAAAAATLAPQPFYFLATARASARLRRFSVPGVTLFAVVNGVVETAIFDAVAMGGGALAAGSVGDSASARAAGAFTALSAYCAAIHALFWENVFPPHVPAPGTPAAKAMRVRGVCGGKRNEAMDRNPFFCNPTFPPVLPPQICLALFGPMTATWCALLLAGGGGKPAVVVAHVVADAAAATALRLAPPWG